MYPRPFGSQHRNRRPWCLERVSDKAKRRYSPPTAVARSRTAAAPLSELRITSVAFSISSSKSTASVVGSQSTLAKFTQSPVLRWVSIAQASNGKPSQDLDDQLHVGKVSYMS